jgi:stage V sporulation protein SpoVS
MRETCTMKVGSGTPASDLARACQRQLLKTDVVLEAVGHGAVGQAIKAVVAVNQLTVNTGVVYQIAPSLNTVPANSGDGEVTVTCLRLVAVTLGLSASAS